MENGWVIVENMQDMGRLRLAVTFAVIEGEAHVAAVLKNECVRRGYLVIAWDIQRDTHTGKLETLRE